MAAPTEPDAPASEVRQRRRPRSGKAARSGGNVVIRKAGRRGWWLGDTYHTILTLSWPRFYRFVDVVVEAEDGVRVVDLTRFHDIVPAGH